MRRRAEIVTPLLSFALGAAAMYLLQRRWQRPVSPVPQPQPLSRPAAFVRPDEDYQWSIDQVLGPASADVGG